MLRAKQLPIVNTVCPGVRRKPGWTSGQTSPPNWSATLLHRATGLAFSRRRASAKVSWTESDMSNRLEAGLGRQKATARHLPRGGSRWRAGRLPDPVDDALHGFRVPTPSRGRHIEDQAAEPHLPP